MARIAFLVAPLFEDSEYQVPYERLREVGHEIVVAGDRSRQDDASHGDVAIAEGKRGEIRAQIEADTASLDAEDFDAVVIPGGYAPDKLRMDPAAVGFVRAMDERGKPIAAICHAGWMLAEAEILEGRTVTSYPSIRKDLEHAGATWEDREVIVDGNLVTSRRPADLDAFCDAVLEQIRKAQEAQPA